GRELGLLVLMGVVQFGLPYVLYSAGIARVTAQEAILIVTLEPVLNPLWVWLGPGETPSVGTIVGGAIILASVTYLALTGRISGRQPPG
ncbi:MAG: EamA family transporter, partial [Planctomycetota bacterium]